MRDERKVVRVDGGAILPVVQIFSGAGQALGAFVWDRGRIALFAWTSSQQLLIVDTEGQVSSGTAPSASSKISLYSCEVTRAA